MRINGEDRDNLIQKRVNLVQSGCFNTDVDKLDENSIKGLDDIIIWDYMGSAEFEWGALPKSLRRITLNMDFYKVFTFEQYKDEFGNPLKVYAPEIFIKNVQEIIDRLTTHGFGLLEYCSLHRHVVKEKSNENELKYKDYRNFWWDIENDFFIFFEHTDKILLAMNALRKRKFGYQKNTPKCAFNKLYLRMLSMGNSMHINTSIKDYYYDENSQIHFIEFLENYNLNTILMEAMLIAKVDKGIVRFNINEVTFNIDEETTLDNIIKENGINLIDRCMCSQKIKDLISSYNEEIHKQRKTQELVHVLKLVRDKK